jgi:hypothetical protein
VGVYNYWVRHSPIEKHSLLAKFAIGALMRCSSHYLSMLNAASRRWPTNISRRQHLEMIVKLFNELAKNEANIIGNTPRVATLCSDPKAEIPCYYQPNCKFFPDCPYNHASTLIKSRLGSAVEQRTDSGNWDTSYHEQL